MGWVKSLLYAVCSTPVACIVPGGGHGTSGWGPKRPVIWPEKAPWSYLCKHTESLKGSAPLRFQLLSSVKKIASTSCKIALLEGWYLFFQIRSSWALCKKMVMEEKSTSRIKALFQSGGDLAPLPASGVQANSSQPLGMLSIKVWALCLSAELG